MQVERILREYGHFLRPMNEAPRDGQRILGHSAQGGHLISCYWELHPQGLIGPNWVEERNSAIGYIDRYFDGWIAPREFRLLDSVAINRLLVAYIDDARAVDNREALKMLEAGELRYPAGRLGEDPLEDEGKWFRPGALQQTRP